MATSKWLKIGLCLVAVFAAGGLTGSLLTLHFGKRMHHHGDPQQLSERVMHRLGSELRLNPEQREKIEPIVLESIQKAQAIHEQNRSQIEATREDSRNKISPLLNAEQRVKFEEIEKQWKERHRDEVGG